MGCSSTSVYHKCNYFRSCHFLCTEPAAPYFSSEEGHCCRLLSPFTSLACVEEDRAQSFLLAVRKCECWFSSPTSVCGVHSFHAKCVRTASQATVHAKLQQPERNSTFFGHQSLCEFELLARLKSLRIDPRHRNNRRVDVALHLSSADSILSLAWFHAVG